MRILFVAGTWDENGGSPSGLAKKMSEHMGADFYNGGRYEDLKNLLESSVNYDYVFWFANVPNDLPKIRDVKEIAPKVMLVSSKRNDDEKYRFAELVARAINMKANLTYEFSKHDDKFKIRIFDPLGSIWYDGFEIKDAVEASLIRLEKLSSITRRHTISSKLPLAWYFDRFSSNMVNGGEKENFQVDDKYLEKIVKLSDVFYNLMSDSMIPRKAIRCAKGMPSFKDENGNVYVSIREVPGEYITKDDFVMVKSKEDDIVYYGDMKPSVDTPIHLELYNALPNIRYIIHSHNYIIPTTEGYYETKNAIPCGAIEEAQEIINVIDDKNKNFYAINEKGHGSLLMVSDIDKLNAEYYKRPIPEKMY